VSSQDRKKDGTFKKGTHWRKPKPHWSKQWLRTKYLTEKNSAAEIGAIAGCTENNILYWLRKHNIPRRDISQVRKAKKWGSSGEANPMFGKFGKGNPNYEDGRTPERQRAYSRSAWKKLVEAVQERDGHKCVRCGAESDLGTHHLKSWAAHAESRYDLQQIVTVCKKCHRWIHSKRNVNYDFLSSRRYSG